MNTTPRSTLAQLVRRKRKAADREAKLARIAKALLEGGMQGTAIGGPQASVAVALSSVGAARGGRTASGAGHAPRRQASPSEAAAAARAEEGASADASEGIGGDETIGRRWLRAATAVNTQPRPAERATRLLRGEEAGDEMEEEAIPGGDATDSPAPDAQGASAPGRRRAGRWAETGGARLPELIVRRLLGARTGDDMAVGAIDYERPTHPAAADAGARAAPRSRRAPGSRERTQRSRPQSLGTVALGDDTEAMRAVASRPAFRREVEKIIEETNHRAQVAHAYGR